MRSSCWILRLVFRPLGVELDILENRRIAGQLLSLIHILTFLDHDDYLEPDAIWQLIRAIHLTDADLLYGDEALTDENLRGILEFRLRPAFSHDYYLSHPYFVHPICVRTEIARAIGGWDENLPISADVDFVLRVIEAARRVAHVPAVPAARGPAAR